ncbi:hypothetical protein ACWGH5_39065 [Streptomyces sp. NPDC054864]
MKDDQNSREWDEAVLLQPAANKEAVQPGHQPRCDDSSVQNQVPPRAWTDLAWALGYLAVMFAAMLMVEQRMGAAGQWGLGVVASVGVVWWLWRREDASVLAQTVVAVVFACSMELLATHAMGWWDYRLRNFPGFVPPAHAVVFLASFVMARSLAPRLPHRLMTGLTLAVAGLWTVWGLFLSPRMDTAGAFWFLVMVAFLWHPVIGPRTPYVFVVTSAVELYGVHFNLWAYRAHDVTGLLSIGNPPAGIAGSYALVDFVAAVLAPRLLRIRRQGGW